MHCAQAWLSPPGRNGTGFGTDGGFQSRFSDLKPMCEPVSSCVSHSVPWCAHLCRSFSVSVGVCVKGGFERVHVLCQHEGLKCIFVCKGAAQDECECVPE